MIEFHQVIIITAMCVTAAILVIVVQRLHFYRRRAAMKERLQKHVQKLGGKSWFQPDVSFRNEEDLDELVIDLKECEPTPLDIKEICEYVVRPEPGLCYGVQLSGKKGIDTIGLWTIEWTRSLALHGGSLDLVTSQKLVSQFKYLDELALRKMTVVPEAWPILFSLPVATSYILNSCGITSGLLTMPIAVGVHHLDVADNPIDDLGIEALALPDTLESINLESTRVSMRILAKLCSIPSMKEINLPFDVDADTAANYVGQRFLAVETKRLLRLK